MPHRFPRALVRVIEDDVKKACKKAHIERWSGFGPIAEAHLSPDSEKAILVWRQASPADAESLKTSFMVGIYHLKDGVWEKHGVTAANYKSSVKLRDVETIINREKEFWNARQTA